MNETSTRAVDPEEKERCIQAFREAARAGTTIGEVVNDLASRGIINHDNLHRILSLGERLAASVKTLVTDRITEWSENIVGCTTPISVGSTLILEPTDGKRTIANAHKVFGYIDTNFRRFGTDAPGQPKDKTRIAVHEGINNGRTGMIFGGIGDDLDDLCFEQDQIIQFVEKYPDWLSTDDLYTTLFLFKIHKSRMVAFVSKNNKGGDNYFAVSTNYFDWFHRMSCENYRYRVVVPQLPLKK